MTPSIQHLTPPVADGCHKRKRAMLDCAAGPTGSHRQKVARMAKEMSPSAAWFREAKDESSEAAGVPTHPLRVKPLGNALDAAENIKDMAGSFSRLPDELLVQILEYLEGVDLLRCGSSCRALYAYCNLDELWKALMIVSPTAIKFTWRGSWRATYLQTQGEPALVDCSHLYSDILHRPFQCANLPIIPYASNIPSRNRIFRLPHLSSSDFTRDWSSTPFILTEPVREWPIFKEWSITKLVEQYQETVFRAEAVDWPLQNYVEYMRRNADESPLYLFDCHFAEKMGLTVDEIIDEKPAYQAPSTFKPDLFAVLGSLRPHHRWLIIGPKGSGSTFHADPNGTSAWNAVIRGSKYWIMFPPPAEGKSVDIPGIHVSPDMSHITAPLSLSEYLLSFHAYARRMPGCVEAVCQEGELLYVPAGWFHMVVNLEEGIAVTQNFVSEAGVVGVLEFMRDRSDQVSGFRKLQHAGEGQEFELFKTRLQEQYPNVYERAMAELLRLDEKRKKKSKWEEISGKSDTNRPAGEGLPESESFGFGFSLEEEIEE